MPLPYTKVVLIEGDYGDSLDRLLKIKQSFGPAEWTEFAAQPRKGDGYEFGQVADAMGVCGFDETPRVVLLKGLPARKEIREGLVKLIPNIESPHTLIIWDAYGTMESDTWNLVRSVCRENGKLLALPKAMDSLYREDQVKAVAAIAMKRGVVLEGRTAEVMLELIGPNRALVDAACASIGSMGLLNPSVAELRENVLPMAIDYPVYQFYADFSTGSFSRIVESVRLLQRSGFPNDIIMSFAVSQCRWQVIGAQQQLKGKNVESTLRSLGAAKNEEEALKRLSRFRPDRWMFRVPAEDDKQPKRALLTSETMIRDTAHFVTSILTKACKVSPPFQCVYEKTIERFLLAYDAMVGLRENSGDKSDAELIQVMQGLSVTK